MVGLVAGQVKDKGIDIVFRFDLPQGVHKLIPGLGRFGIANLGKHVGAIEDKGRASHPGNLYHVAFIAAGVPGSLVVLSL